MNKGGGITLICDVLVGPRIREQTDHLLALLLGCDEQGGAPVLHCDVLVGHASESRDKTTSRCPLGDAMNKEVAPPCIAMSLSAHASESRRITSVARADKDMAPRGGRSALCCRGRQTSQIRVVQSPCSSHLQGSGTTLHCDVLVGPCTDHLEVSTLRCDEQKGGAALHCDVLVVPCIRERTNHLLVPLLICDERGGGTTLHCDVLVGPRVKEQTDHLQVSAPRCNEPWNATILHRDVFVGP